jgi:hypothetical protein
MKNFLTSSALAAALAVPATPFAALPTGNIEFLIPTATVSSTDVIDIRVRFTLDSTSSDLTFSSEPLTGFAAADLPLQGTYVDSVTGEQDLRDFASISNAFLNTTYYCADTFVNVCSPSTNYSFKFWTSSEPGQPSINFLDSFALIAGGSTEYLFGQYLPEGGGAAAGTYTFYNNTLDLIFQGKDAAGNAISYQHTLGQSCASFTPDCAFTRTVITTPVPEPSSLAMMSLGMLGVGLHVRRRRDRVKP